MSVGLKRAYDAYQKEWRTADYSKKTYESCEKSYKKYRRKRFWVSRRRKRKFFESCMQKVSQKAVAQRNKELPLWQLAKMSTEIEQYIPSKNGYFQLFGYPNVHVHGEISGTDQNGFMFQHFYREGIFKGVGVVNNYKRSKGLRAPASTNSF